MNSEEIAKLANVSRSTVSRVINNYSNVPEATRIKVQKIIDEYGYTPNYSARNLAGKANNIIEIFIADINQGDTSNKWIGINSPYNMELLSHIINDCKKRGYLTLVNIITSLKECKEMEGNFKTKMIYGGILVGFPYKIKEVEDLIQKGHNLVLIDLLSPEDDVSNEKKLVNSDDYQGGYEATQFLIDNGHKKILHVAGDKRLSSLEREKGFRVCMKDNNLKEIKVIYGNYRENIAYEKIKKYLETDIPTGIFIANDLMAIGVVRAIEEKGLKIPEDISIIGYDNLDSTNFLKTNLTTMETSRKDIGEKSVNLIFQEKNLHLLCEPKLIEKESVRRIKQRYNEKNVLIKNI